MLFEVFSHSFFNHEAEMSAAEMIAQFHFYLLGNPEGLAFDCPDEDYATAIWEPADPARGEARRPGAHRRRRHPAGPGRRTGGGWAPPTAPQHPAEHVVLAVDPPALAALVAASPGLAGAGTRSWWRGCPRSAPPARRTRWRDTGATGTSTPSRAVFNGVSRQPTLDSVTLYHRLENESRRWARRTGGSVMELHAYACETGVPAEELAERMRAELVDALAGGGRLRVRELRARVEAQAPAFTPGSHAGRPGVRTDADRRSTWPATASGTDFPSALMERSAATGIIAANHILRAEGGAAEPVRSIRPHGLLAPPPPLTPPPPSRGTPPGLPSPGPRSAHLPRRCCLDRCFTQHLPRRCADLAGCGGARGAANGHKTVKVVLRSIDAHDAGDRRRGRSDGMSTAHRRGPVDRPPADDALDGRDTGIVGGRDTGGGGLGGRRDDGDGGGLGGRDEGGYGLVRDVRARVVTALRLGWWMADAYHHAQDAPTWPPDAPRPSRPPAKLSNLTEMSASAPAAACTSTGWTSRWPRSPTLARHNGPVRRHRRPPEPAPPTDRAAPQTAVPLLLALDDLNMDVLRWTMATNHRVGLAYRLGPLVGRHRPAGDAAQLPGASPAGRSRSAGG